MSKSKIFFLQLFFVLIVALVPSLFVVRFFKPTKALAESMLENDQEEFLNPLVEMLVEEAQDSQEKKISPSSISIPSLGMNLSIAPGIIENNEWTLYDDKVAWLSTSDVPGNGNVILYAHNRKDLFKPLHDVEIGAEVIIEHNGWEYLYEISETKKVLPTDVGSVLSDREQLTLYTCDGTFDEKRHIVVARPKA